jgi:hypothetical protein
VVPGRGIGKTNLTWVLHLLHLLVVAANVSEATLPGTSLLGGLVTTVMVEEDVVGLVKPIR